MRRAVSTIFASGLLLAASSACSNATTHANGDSSVRVFLSERATTQTGDIAVRVRALSQQARVTALQWTFRYDGDLLSPVSFTAGPKSLEAKKAIRCASQKNETRCICWGNGAQPIPDGDIAEAIFRPRAGAQIPKAAIALDHAIATSGEGKRLAVAPALSTVSIAISTKAGGTSRSNNPEETHHERNKTIKTAAAIERR